MSSPPNEPSANAPSGDRDSWASRHAAALIGALAVIVAAIIALAGVLIKDVDPAPDPDPDPKVTTESSARGSTPPSEPPVSRPATTDPATPPKVAAPKAHWVGVATLPFSLNMNSNAGAELDGANPGKLVPAGDDLRGDFSSSAKIMVMSGRVAYAIGDIDRRASCENAKSSGVANTPAAVSIYVGTQIGGAYCMLTTEGRLAAFEIVSAEGLPLPSSVTVKVVLWD